MNNDLALFGYSLDAEGVQDVLAVEKLGDHRDWISEKENIILDIDEDFFGCEAAADRFTQVTSCC